MTKTETYAILKKAFGLDGVLKKYDSMAPAGGVEGVVEVLGLGEGDAGEGAFRRPMVGIREREDAGLCVDGHVLLAASGTRRLSRSP